MGTQLSSPKNWAELPIFGPFLLWSNGWVHQDATWCVGWPQPRLLCVRWGPSSLTKKGADPPIVGPCLLWSNGCMDQDATWYRCRARRRRHCVRWLVSPGMREMSSGGQTISVSNLHYITTPPPVSIHCLQVQFVLWKLKVFLRS